MRMPKSPGGQERQVRDGKTGRIACADGHRQYQQSTRRRTCDMATTTPSRRRPSNRTTAQRRVAHSSSFDRRRRQPVSDSRITAAKPPHFLRVGSCCRFHAASSVAHLLQRSCHKITALTIALFGFIAHQSLHHQLTVLNGNFVKFILTDY